MKIIAQRDSETYLIQTSPQSGRILNLQEKRFYPVTPLQLILAQGEWEDYHGSQDELPTLLAPYINDVALRNMPLAPLQRYVGQTAIYGAGHKIIGNIGNGVGLKAETSLAKHRANRSSYIAAKGQDAYNRRARSLHTKANAAAAALTPTDRQAMGQRRDELVQIAATAKTAQERRVARAGAVLLTRQMTRYDKAQARTKAPTKAASTPKAPKATPAKKAPAAARPKGTSAKPAHAGSKPSGQHKSSLHAAHALLEFAKSLLETGKKVGGG